MSYDYSITEEVTEPTDLVVIFKPVPFMSKDPELWFALIELQFELRHVDCQRRRFLYASEAIPGEYYSLIRYFILEPHESSPYDRLKERLLQFFLPSKEERLRKLLQRQPLGDAKPSQHLATLRSLVDPKQADSNIIGEL